MINAKINFKCISYQIKKEIIEKLKQNFDKLINKELKKELNNNEFIILKLEDFIFNNDNSFWFILFYYEKLSDYEFKQKNLFKLVITQKKLENNNLENNNLIDLKFLLKMESVGYIFITQNFVNNFNLFFEKLFDFIDEYNNKEIEFINFNVSYTK
ncbi:MAG: hypothetical protein N2485_04965 [bacterium]|nr:hypothetical protein [bacterium]